MRDIFTEIWSTTKRNKLRTGLTGFAVAWGIFMLIVLLGAGNGLINAQLKQSSRFLSSSMVIFGGETSKPYKGLKEGRQINVQTNDLKTTQEQFDGTIDEVGAQYYTSGVISLGQQYISTQIAGVYPNHPKIDKIEMMSGRFVNYIDIREKRKVLILSNKQAKELTHSEPESLIGKHVNVGNFASRWWASTRRTKTDRPTPSRRIRPSSRSTAQIMRT